MAVDERKLFAALDSSETVKQIIKRVNELDDDIFHIQRQIGILMGKNKTLEKKIKDLVKKVQEFFDEL